MTRAEIVDLFTKNAIKAGAEVARAGGDEELNRIAEQILAGDGSIFCPRVTEKEKAIAMPQDRRTEDYVSASACVEEILGAVAETGSLVLSSRERKPVQVGLLPSHHVAIVSAEKIYENLNDLFATFGDSPPTNITFETGPSRTADIELTLTLGVHGPERLSIIVVEG
jgi:L-lactate dehydrogenase complex protein LldG